MKKWSIFNITEHTESERIVLYNYLNDCIIILLPELYQLVKKHEDVNELKEIYPEFFDLLCNNGFVVEDSIDENKLAMKSVNQRLSSPEKLFLTINPTLDCNLRCWYCYETHTTNCYMNEDIMERIVKLVERETQKKELHTICLSFFGGEPLLKAKKIAIPLIRIISNICHKRDKRIQVNFTSNGVLLSKSVLESLKELKVNIHFQIPFDGGRINHNKTKHLPNGKGTYNIILNNINNALSKDFNVTFRCNYTSENIESFKELVDDICNIPEGNKEKVLFSLQRIWQTSPTKDLYKKEEEIQKYIISKGFTKNTNNQKILCNCYADYESSLMINYNGDIFKCTARDFHHNNRIGTLEKDGNILNSDKSLLYRDKRFGKDCLTCRLLPICTVCIQKKIENDKCPINITSEEIDRLIRMRMKIIINDNIQ